MKKQNSYDFLHKNPKDYTKTKTKPKILTLAGEHIKVMR